MSPHVTLVPRDLLRRAFDMVLAQWPDVILPGMKTFHLNDGCNMRQYNETHFPIEEWALRSDFPDELDDIIGTVEHYVAQSLHSALRNLSRVHKADLDFEAFVSRFDSHPNFQVVSDAQD